MENQNRTIFFFLSENSRVVENWNGRILVLWKMGTGEFSFCGKWERENSRFVEKQRVFFFFYPRILLLLKTRIQEFFFFSYPRILVLWKTGIGEFFFFIRRFLYCGKPESENFFLFLFF